MKPKVKCVQASQNLFFGTIESAFAPFYFLVDTLPIHFAICQKQAEAEAAQARAIMVKSDEDEEAAAAASAAAAKA